MNTFASLRITFLCQTNVIKTSAGLRASVRMRQCCHLQFVGYLLQRVFQIGLPEASLRCVQGRLAYYYCWRVRKIAGFRMEREETNIVLYVSEQNSLIFI